MFADACVYACFWPYSVNVCVYIYNKNIEVPSVPFIWTLLSLLMYCLSVYPLEHAVFNKEWLQKSKISVKETPVNVVFLLNWNKLKKTDCIIIKWNCLAEYIQQKTPSHTDDFTDIYFLNTREKQWVEIEKLKYLISTGHVHKTK